jgi:hypothetical protein
MTLPIPEQQLIGKSDDTSVDDVILLNSQENYGLNNLENTQVNNDNTGSILKDDDKDNNASEKMTLIKLLCHFAAYTSQKQEHMTYLLKLLKLYEPTPNYCLLPSTGKELKHIDGNDWHTASREIPISRKLPSPVQINDGKYVHFGLENALSGNSAGLVHCDSDLLQFVDIYFTNPGILPKGIRKRVTSNKISNLFTISLILTLICHRFKP